VLLIPPRLSESADAGAHRAARALLDGAQAARSRPQILRGVAELHPPEPVDLNLRLLDLKCLGDQTGFANERNPREDAYRPAP